MQRLSAIDSAFIYLDNPNMPMHVGTIQIVQLPDNYEGRFSDRFKALLQARKDDLPMMHWKVAEQPLDLDYPVWTEDPDFNLDDHLHVYRLNGGTLADVERDVELIHSRRMDLTKPLFEFHIFEGLQDNQVAIYGKIHHATIDGQGAMAMLAAMYDLTEQPRTEPLTDAERKALGLDRTASPKPTLATALIDATYSALEYPVRGQMKAIGKTVAALTKQYRRADNDPAANKTAIGYAPRTRFNIAVSNKRRFAGRSLDLATAKAIKNATGAKLNDVVVAAVGGAVRRYLLELDELPEQSLLAGAPMAMPMKEDSTNNLSVMALSLGTDEADPLKRIAKVHQSSQVGKQNAGGFNSATYGNGLRLPASLMKRLFGMAGNQALAGLVPPIFNVMVSNVPGPNFPFYVAGAKLVANYPVSLVTHTVGLNITVASYCGNLDVGIIADPEAVNNPHHLMDLLAEEFEAMTQALAEKQEDEAAPFIKAVPTDQAA